MHISTEKSALRTFCEAQTKPGEPGFAAAAQAFFAQDAAINMVHPFNELDGAAGYVDGFLVPLHRSFSHLRRSAYLAFGGIFEGSTWVTSTGYYTGQFEAPFLGIKPTGTLAHLRYGEFHRMEGGRAIESYIYLDLPELMIAAGQWPIADSPGLHPGFTGFLPGPTTQDGLQWGASDAGRSAGSLDIVKTMLLKLATPDEAWRPYWRDDMLWYGPAAFGSFVGIEEFAGFQVPFEQTFSEWIGGLVPGSLTKQFTRFADGDYICSGGWPALNAVQIKPFLGQPPEGKRLFMRVCDWWRREGDLLVENWVFVDIPHVLLQMDYDLFAEIEKGGT